MNEEETIRKQIRGLVMGNKVDVMDESDDSIGLLVSLIKACKLTNSLFSKDERKLAKQRIDEIAKDEKYGKAVSDTVQAVQASIIASVTAVSAASAVGSSSN